MTTTPAANDSKPRSRGRASNDVRPAWNGVLSIRHATIAVKAYVATTDSPSLDSSTVHRGCGSRMKQQYVCVADGAVVESADRIKLFHHEGTDVELTRAELASLDGRRRNRVDVLEFVPADTVDVVYIKKTYYLGPGAQADRHFKTLVTAMTQLNQVAIGRCGKDDQLVFVRAYQDGLVLHDAFYADQVRSFGITDPVSADCVISPRELDGTRDLIQGLSHPRFDPEKYRDDYDDRLRAAVARKAAGGAILSELGELAKTTPKKKRSEKAG